MSTTTVEQPATGDIYKLADSDGQFRRQISQFRSFISSDPTSRFPAEPNRYALYLNYGCPWAHRVNIILHLKSLTGIIQIISLDYELSPDGWFFSGRDGTDSEDPLYGFKFLKDVYRKADPGYSARFTVPLLWDKKTETAVNNESSEILRMMYTEFDAFIPEARREATLHYFPKELQGQIDEMNEWVYNTVNNGVYKTGFATTQAAYNEHVTTLFASLDRLEKHLDEKGSKYLFGDHLTEADIRLYTTMIRFDVAYYTIFKCNLKMVRHDYPRLHEWLRRLYWDEGEESNGGVFRKTTNFDHIKFGYTKALKSDIVPAGPVPHVQPL